MMFIEVTTPQGTKALVNTRHIEMVKGSTIYMAFNIPHGVEQDVEQDNIFCKESYEEIKTLILEARKNENENKQI